MTPTPSIHQGQPTQFIEVCRNPKEHNNGPKYMRDTIDMLPYYMAYNMEHGLETVAIFKIYPKKQS